MTNVGQGFWLPDQKRGSVPVFGANGANDWRPFALSGATINYSTRTITITGGVTKVRAYVSFGTNMSGQTYTP